MITWMQRHKKYLVVTIWISTIAFVGAGFVGWGSYNFSSSANSIATVNETEISMEDLNKEYSRLYSYYNQLTNNKFTKEMAEQFKLQDQAVNNLLTKAKMIEFAKEIGLSVIDSEIGQKIGSMEVFFENGQFSKEKYLTVLKNAGYKPKSFEDGLKEEILIEKLQALFDIKNTQTELNTLHASLYIKDRVELKVINSQDVNYTPTEDEIKKFWESNQMNYLSKPKFVLKYKIIDLNSYSYNENELSSFYEENKFNYKNSDGKIKTFDEVKELVIKDIKLKIAKKDALKQYLELKKDELKDITDITLDSDDLKFGMDFINSLNTINKNDVIKPVEVENGYIIAKLVDKVAPKPFTFDEAKESVKQDLMLKYKKDKISELAKVEVNSFKGTDIGFVSREDASKIELLSQIDAAEFLQKLFESKTKNGFVILNDKAVIYKILEQKLLDYNESEIDKEFISQNVQNLKDNLSNKGLLNFINNRYETELHYQKGN
ncbi:MAG: peptidylprolyl isomerase [Campylobacterales bacterium]|nr:peptidylprolyl isomerase [Campylobacterales bacterium]